MNIIIIGGTGFLGRNLVKHIRSLNDNSNIIITGHSEYKIALFKKKFADVPVTLSNIDNDKEYLRIEDLIITYDINCIIHTAAMKHVNICQENIVNTLYTNVIFSQQLVNICKKHKIENLIAISTDKANNPCNVYGMSKYMMEKIIFDNKFKIFQGVNFFWSDGSVLDIWFNQYKLNKPLTYTKLDSIRYYDTIDHISKTIYDGINSQDNILFTDKVYKISLETLLDAFCQYFNYTNKTQTSFNDYEKDIEELFIHPDKHIEIVEPTLKEVINLIDLTYKNIICS